MWIENYCFQWGGKGDGYNGENGYNGEDGYNGGGGKTGVRPGGWQSHWDAPSHIRLLYTISFFYHLMTLTALVVPSV